MQIRLFAIGAAVLAVALVGCSSSAQETASRSPAAVPLANVDLANTRNAPSPIDSTTVNDLDLAWSLPLQAKGEGLRYIGSPVVAAEVVYLQDPRSNVEAIDLETGELLWETRFDEPVSGPNGVIFADGMVFGATRSGAFSLDATTGKETWSTKLVRNASEQIAMAPGYHDGRVYLSTVADKGEGNEVGVLWALDEMSGKPIWHFDTVPRGLWGRPEINFGGGLEFAPAFDGEGSMYVGISNPGPVPGTPRHPWGSSRPGRNLYSNSIVKLDEKSGEVEWHYQLTPHGVCSGGFASPVLADIGKRKVVIGAGLGGIAMALDRQTGEPVWRRPVGIHNGHDDDGLLAMRGEYKELKTPMTAYPGLYGGVFGLLSLRDSTLFVPVANGAVRVLSQSSLEPVGTYDGELVALDVATGAVEWKQRFPSPLLGPTTVTNDLVFATSLDGGVAAFEADSGKEVWAKELPGQTEGGMTVAGDTLLVRTGSSGLAGEMPKLLAYRLAD
jgi:outer membrane protein assembly factor BamB